jgi:hypothetical protein
VYYCAFPNREDVKKKCPRKTIVFQFSPPPPPHHASISATEKLTLYMGYKLQIFPVRTKWSRDLLYCCFAVTFCVRTPTVNTTECNSQLLRTAHILWRYFVSLFGLSSKFQGPKYTISLCTQNFAEIHAFRHIRGYQQFHENIFNAITVETIKQHICIPVHCIKKTHSDLLKEVSGQ